MWFRRLLLLHLIAIAACSDEAGPKDDGNGDAGAGADTAANDDAGRSDAGSDAGPTDGSTRPATCVASGDGLFVAADGRDSADGSPTNPMRSIGRALDRGRRVHVAVGTYREDLELTDAEFLIGGYTADPRDGRWCRRDGERSRLESEDPSITPTALRIDGDLRIVGFEIEGGRAPYEENTAVAVINAAPVLDDCRLVGGGDRETLSTNGIYVAGRDSHPVLTHCEIDGGRGSQQSAGVTVVEGASVDVIDSEVTGGSGPTSTVGNRYGLYVESADILVSGSTIDGGDTESSTTTDSASALGANFDSGATGFIEKSMLSGGRARHTAGIYAQGPTTAPIVRNSRIRGGHGPVAQAVAVIDAAEATIVNTTLESGSPSSPVLTLEFLAGAKLINSILLGNVRADACITSAELDLAPRTMLANRFHNCGAALLTTDAGNRVTSTSGLETMSHFVTASANTMGDPGLAADGWHLFANSELIDLGVSASAADRGAVVDDIDGETRPKGAGWDIGPDEAR